MSDPLWFISLENIRKTFPFWFLQMTYFYGSLQGSRCSNYGLHPCGQDHRVLVRAPEELSERRGSLRQEDSSRHRGKALRHQPWNEPGTGQTDHYKAPVFPASIINARYQFDTSKICIGQTCGDHKSETLKLQGFLDSLKDLLADSNPMVVANAVAALSEINEASQSGQPLIEMNTATINKVSNSYLEGPFLYFSQLNDKLPLVLDEFYQTK